MLGLGETEDEVLQAMEDLRAAQVRHSHAGPIPAADARHLPVVEFVPPESSRDTRKSAEAMGFIHVASGPMVRSSYHADEFPVGRNLAGWTE